MKGFITTWLLASVFLIAACANVLDPGTSIGVSEEFNDRGGGD